MRSLPPLLGLLLVLLLGYFPLVLHPSLHTACPENDTWNLPIRWSVLTALRGGHLPLWNPLSAFGIPWLATWQTGTFYPGTWLFRIFGLGFWNLSGLLHLLVFSLGLFFLLRRWACPLPWALTAAGVGLLNGCAFNHLGSNSSMDTLAWMPWVFWAVHVLASERRGSFLPLALFLSLQIFAGYPQIILYTLLGASAYAAFLGGPRLALRTGAAFGLSLLFTCAQWLPSVEYFFTQAARLPAVHDNPDFFLPLKNLRTLWDPSALARDGRPDFVADPTFFYFNLYSGILPLIVILAGSFRVKKLSASTRFFLLGTLAVLLWSLGFPGLFFGPLHLPFPAFLEPAKSWVLFDLFFLASLALVLKDLFPKPGIGAWVLGGLCVLNLLVYVHLQPLERNLLPGDPILTTAAAPFQANLGTGRALVLPDAAHHAGLYTPLPDPDHKPLFKRFIPNSNYFVSLPLATFYGSTQPSWGALDAAFYFQYVFSGDKGGGLMDLLGVDLLYVPSDRLPAHYQKVMKDGDWTLWKNPHSLGDHFFFSGEIAQADRKTVFTRFAAGLSDPRQTLFLDRPEGMEKDRPIPPDARVLELEKGHPAGFLVVTQNALPGWRAWVDGKGTGIARADGIFQAIEVPAGAQEVRLSYEPTSFRLGLFLSLLGGAWLLARVLLLRRKP
ncbi:MAG TPA: YfhO family protein [bacterium]|nr:YfhO family protein [bacterium]